MLEAENLNISSETHTPIGAPYPVLLFPFEVCSRLEKSRYTRLARVLLGQEYKAFYGSVWPCERGRHGEGPLAP